MSGINKVIVMGRLGKDPEVRYLQDGTPVANLSVATSEEWKDKGTGEKKQKTEWHRIIAFNKLADTMGKYLEKGRRVYIEGKLQTREWQDNTGNKRYTTEIVAAAMQFIDSIGNSSEGAASRPGAPAQKPRQNTSAPFSGDSGKNGGYDPGDYTPGYDSMPPDDDIPF